MVKKIFYNSSLPRAGSTLIQNILAQNPDIHSTPTSGVYEIMAAARTIYSDGQEFKAQNSAQMEEGFKGFLKGGIYGFYNNVTDRPYVMEKCRGWNSEYDFIKFYDDKPKIIQMIRDPRAIFASLEKKFRKNPHIDNHLTDWSTLTGTTVDGRIQVWSAGPPIGPSMDRLYDSLVRKFDEHILFVPFEDLCQNPEGQLQRIYNYLELPYYQHDFDNIDQYTVENDKVYGVFGDHLIRQQLKPVENDFIDILGERGAQTIRDHYDWFYTTFGYE